MTINVLVLCQRSYGTQAFKKEYITTIEKDINYLIHLNSDDDDDIIVTDFLTTGLNHPDDKMTFKINFDYKNRETLEFVRDHQNYYSYIVIGGCPFYIFNKQNVYLLSNILKENGNIIISPSNNPKFKQWFEQNETIFQSFFNIIEDKPKIIMKKKRTKRKADTIIIDDEDNDEDQKTSYNFKTFKRKSIRKTRKSVRKTRKSVRKTRKSIRKTRKSVRKTRKSVRKTRKSVRNRRY